MSRAVSLLGLLVLLLGDFSHAEEARKVGQVGVTFLPELVSGYSFLATWYPDLLQGLESPEGQEKHKLLARLHKSLHALFPSGSLPSGIGSAQRTFLVQSAMKGHVYGYAWAKEPDYMTLFITLPASEAAREIVVISSGVAPQATTIFSLDTSLDAVLIYRFRVTNVRLRFWMNAASCVLPTSYRIT